jgi:glucosamine-6-phosphate deaminase
VVTLDEACRRQQVGEGWFPSVADVPARAITMSIAQILKARAILCIVPEARKAAAVKRCLEGEIGPLAPASALRKHADVSVFLDRESASLLGT